MSGRERRAALPPTDYRKAPVLDADGLVIRPVSGAGKPLGVWDFRDSPGPVDFRRALVAGLAAQGRGWGSEDTYQTNTSTLRLLSRDAAAAEPPVAATEQITVEWWKQWTGDIHVRRVLAAVVRRAPGVPEATRVFLQTPRRRPPARRGRPRKQAHTREELRRIRDAAAATVRVGRLRISKNTAVLERWRAGAIERGDGDWPLGEVLDVLARTGDLPRYPNSVDHAVTAYAERAFGFEGNAASLSRLFATPVEIGAAAVLLIVHEAWNLEAATNAAVGQVTSALPVLSTTDANAALEAAVPIPVRGAARFLEELADHMAAHPDALTSGSSLCPPVLLRLAQVLHEAGHPVVRPGCAHCGKIRSDLRQLRPEGRVCGSCDARSRNRETCARCHREGQRVAARRPEGPICHRCYRADPATFEECADCGELRHPVVRRDDGRGLCMKCWKCPLHTCVSCGKTAAAALVDDDGALCRLCYNRHRRPRRLCGRCGQVKRIARNARDGQPDLCDGCYQGPEAPCSICSRVRPCTSRDQQGEPICATCYQRHRTGEPCARCGRTKPVNTRWPIGPVCTTCYTAVLRSPAECPRCGMVQPLIARGEDGAEVCGPCVGFAADYTCRQCGRAGNPHSRGRCAHCVLAERVNALLAGPDGTVSPQMEPLAAALTDAPSPFPAIQWIKESPNTRLLARLAADGQVLSHELLDELPPSRNQRYIRQLLVHTGILEERHEDLERIPGWLEHELADKPATHANLARPFLHWFLLRRARQRAAHRHHPASADRDLRRRVSVALDFLAWMDQRDMVLADLAQEHIDDWIAGATSQRRYLIRYFLKWTTSRRLTRELTVPSIPRQAPQDLLDEDDRWPLFRCCLTDDALPTDVRAAGAITLLFGPSTERLCHLTSEHLKFDDKHAHLVLGRHPVLLPPRLAELLRQLAEQPQLRPQLSRVHPGPRWLFPGMVPGKPTSTHGMTQKLGRHGIPVRTARNPALAALAADLPSPILADVTGMHRHTALRWVAYARRDWAEYLAARAADETQSAHKGREGARSE